MKLAILGYIPPISAVPYAEAFYENITEWKTTEELILFTDQPGYPESVVQLKKQINEVKDPGKPFAVSNYIWLTAVRIAIGRGLTHFIYVEADSRVGADRWDSQVFDEMFGAEYGNGDRLACGGTVVCYSPCNVDYNFTKRWFEYLASAHADGKLPIPCYGAGGAAEKGNARVMVNGSLAVFNVEWLSNLFPEGFDGTLQKARTMTAWDFELGLRLFQSLGPDVFTNVVHLRSVFSGYGNVQMTEAERQALLVDGKVVAVHQIESEWKPVHPSTEAVEYADQIIRDGVRFVTPEPRHIDPNLLRHGVPEGQPLVQQELTVGVDPGGKDETKVSLIERKTDGTLVVNPFKIPEVLEAIGIQGNVGGVGDPGRNNPIVSVFIVSYPKDLAWLKWCLRSIKKFATGFLEVVVLWPSKGFKLIEDVRLDMAEDGFTFRTESFDEVEGKGHLHHMVMKCNADRFCLGDHIMHLDSDCVFSEPVTPADYFVDGKPVLVIEPYYQLEDKNDPRFKWQAFTEASVGFKVAYETMCRHPAVHPLELYPRVRKQVESEYPEGLDAYVLSLQPDFPYGFSEFNTMGAVAYAQMQDQYHWVDLEHEARPPDKLEQWWSHSPPSKIWRNGPMEKFGVPFIHFKNMLGI